MILGEILSGAGAGMLVQAVVGSGVWVSIWVEIVVVGAEEGVDPGILALVVGKVHSLVLAVMLPGSVIGSGV